jgi:hypothetical protein
MRKLVSCAFCAGASTNARCATACPAATSSHRLRRPRPNPPVCALKLQRNLRRATRVLRSPPRTSPRPTRDRRPSRASAPVRGAAPRRTQGRTIADCVGPRWRTRSQSPLPRACREHPRRPPSHRQTRCLRQRASRPRSRPRLPSRRGPRRRNGQARALRWPELRCRLRGHCPITR